MNAGAQPTADEMEGKEFRAEDALPTLTHDYMDPALVLAGVADCETDAEAAAYWKAHNPAFIKQPGDHAAIKSAVVAHRKHLAAELAARTIEAEPETVADESMADEGNPF